MANGQYMQQASSQSDLDAMLGKLPSGTKEDIMSYKTRWAGVQLAVLDPTTSKPSRVQFLLVSYHGREKRKQAGLTSVTAIQSPVKAILAQDFVAEVARAGAQSSFLFGVPGGSSSKCIPGFIAGDWNADISAFFNFNSLAYKTIQWTCTHHEPRRPHSEFSVRVDSDGVFKGHIDYGVTVNFKHDHELSCDVTVTDIQALVHSKLHRTNQSFDHDPLLIKLAVTPRHQGSSSGTTSVSEQKLASAGARRAAAAVAEEKLKIALGPSRQRQARMQPPPSFHVAEHPSSTETSPIKPAAKQIQAKPAVAKPTKIAAPAAAAPSAPAAKPPAPPTALKIAPSSKPILLNRCPERYELSRKYEDYTEAKLKDALKAMALDALRVPNGRGHSISDYSEAYAQPWWPHGATKTAEFDTLNEGARRKLYAELQALLREQGTSVEAEEKATREPVIAAAESTAQKSNIVAAAGVVGRALRKSLSRLGSKKEPRSTSAREP